MSEPMYIGHRIPAPPPPTDWNGRFIRLAAEVAHWSKDPDCKVGAVVVSPDRRLFSVGYNGLPRSLDSLAELGFDPVADKNRFSLHAEENAISQAGRSVEGWSLYVTKAPCLRCALGIHRAGIVQVHTPFIELESKWASEQMDAQRFLRQMGVYVLERETFL